MHLENEIRIACPLPQILEAAYRVEQWPALLPHYHRVKVLAEHPEEQPPYRIVRMAAWRGWFPMQWTARQWKDDHHVYFRHLRGPARGMDVVWDLDEDGSDVTVTIRHDLTYPVPVLGPLVARFIIGALFIRPTASLTLRSFKRLLEEKR